MLIATASRLRRSGRSRAHHSPMATPFVDVATGPVPAAESASRYICLPGGRGLDKERGNDQRDRREQLHEDVQGWPGRVLKRIADRVPDDGGLVGVASLPTADFDELFR